MSVTSKPQQRGDQSPLVLLSYEIKNYIDTARILGLYTIVIYRELTTGSA
jgi:hypothetical protein